MSDTSLCRYASNWPPSLCRNSWSWMDISSNDRSSYDLIDEGGWLTKRPCLVPLRMASTSAELLWKSKELFWLSSALMSRHISWDSVENCRRGFVRGRVDDDSSSRRIGMLWTRGTRGDAIRGLFRSRVATVLQSLKKKHFQDQNLPFKDSHQNSHENFS